MSWSRVSSFAGVLVAAAASVATSQPYDPPDWQLSDSVSGQTTLAPNVEYTTVYVKTRSHAVGSSLTISAALDPAPPQGTADKETPIVLFADIVERKADGSIEPPTRMHALPEPSWYSTAPGEYERAATASVPDTFGERVYVVRFAWSSPDPMDRSVPFYDERTKEVIRVDRPLEPRRPTTIRWRADIHAEGQGTAPPSAIVEVELAQ